MEAQQRPTLFYFKRISGFILLLAMSAVFLFSAGTKLWVLEPFEWSFVDVLPVNITVAGILARLMIGLEVATGLLLLAHYSLRKFTYKLTLGILLFFTLYLLALILKTGNNGNCGCFGEAVQMKPLTAIYKNLVMMGVTVLLMYIYPVKPYKKDIIAAALAILLGFITPFVIRPVYLFTAGQPMQQPIDLSLVPEYARPVPVINLAQGKHIVAFLSLTCPHCVHAANHLERLYDKYPKLPVYAILGGRVSRLDSFLNESGMKKVPYTVLDNSMLFGDLAGQSVPTIYWINNSIIERKSNTGELEPAILNKWLNAQGTTTK